MMVNKQQTLRCTETLTSHGYEVRLSRCEGTQGKNKYIDWLYAQFSSYVVAYNIILIIYLQATKTNVYNKIFISFLYKQNKEKNVITNLDKGQFS